MKIITLASSDSSKVLTMSSLEMVSYVNSTRSLGESELRHDNFMAKVPKVLGIRSPEFLGDQKDSQGRTYKCYNFPKREAMLMAMSYSYDLQAQIFDAWESAEAVLTKAKAVSLIPNFDNPIEAAEAWISEKKVSIALTNEIKEAQPKIAFHDAVVADDTTYSLAEAAKLLNIPPRTFNRELRDAGYLMRNNVAYQYFVGRGVFVSQYTGFVLPCGGTAPATTRVTSKGITYLQKKFAEIVA